MEYEVLHHKADQKILAKLIHLEELTDLPFFILARYELPIKTNVHGAAITLFAVTEVSTR